MISKNENSPELIICAAYDTLSSEIVPIEYHKKLLQTDFMALSKIGALPGFIPFIYWNADNIKRKNLSTDLKITNGSKGIIRQIMMKKCSSNFTYSKAALIKFSDSLIKCSNLPPGYFLIEPVTWTFSTALINEDGTKI